MMLNIIKQCATCATRRAGYGNKRFMSFSYPSPRTLAEITNLPLLEAEDANGIKTIWETHHDAQETCISGTFSSFSDKFFNCFNLSIANLYSL